MVLVVAALVTGPWVSSSVPAARRQRALNGERAPVARKSCATRKFHHRFVRFTRLTLDLYRIPSCGLRYARSRAKKEGGNQTQRRKKDKGGITKRDSATPPTSASPSYSSMRRSYDASFSSAGSNSGSEIYPQTGHHMLNEITPSPSPPASNVNFVHYSPGENRQSYSNSNVPFYNSSPLSNPPVLHPQDQPQGNQLPPLDHISSFVDRNLHSTGSPVSHSPLATAPPASYERDRDRDRPAPVSVGPRHHSSRRSILTHQ
jgi:hypothetical protein